MEHRNRRKSSPSQQDIQDHLAGLNRLSLSWSPTRESELAGEKGIDNYLKWFKMHGIAIHQDEKGNTWKLGRTPHRDNAKEKP